MSLPARFRTHTIVIRPYEGGGSHGAVLGDPVTVTCRVEDEIQLVRDSSGAEVVSSTRVFCDVDVVIPPESEVAIVGGRTTTVITEATFTSGGRSRLDHKEVALK